MYREIKKLVILGYLLFFETVIFVFEFSYSPRNHLLFTPLLSSTAVGTLEFRSIAEPLKYKYPNLVYYRSKIYTINPYQSTVTVELLSPDDELLSSRTLSSLSPLTSPSLRTKTLAYDFLIIGTGAKVNTYNIPGVTEYTYCLKELQDARAIRKRLLTLLETCSNPAITNAERDKLLHIVIIGGGPTGIEVAAEIHDFISQDIKRLYPYLNNQHGFRITIIEGKEILSGFDDSLREYTMQRFTSYRQRITIQTGVHVIKINENFIYLNDNTKIAYGLCIWSAGIASNVEWNKIIETGEQDIDRKFYTDRWGHLIVDNYLRVLESSSIEATEKSVTPFPRMYAMGDCASVEKNPYAATAQVAEQQGYYLANIFNQAGTVTLEHERKSSTAEKNSMEVSKRTKDIEIYCNTPTISPFQYRHRGSLAFVGSFAAITDFTNPKTMVPLRGTKIRGFISFLLWRSAYLTKLGSWRNRMNVPFDWIRSFLFGRDTTLF